MASHSNQNVDFENFSVNAERTAEIRAQVERVRAENWIDQLSALAKELGETEEEGESNSQGSLPGLQTLKGNAIQVWRAPIGHVAEGTVIQVGGADLKVIFESESLLEIGFLPKNDEYVVFHLAHSRWEKLLEIVNSLAPELKAASKKKSERQAKWKARFEKQS